MFVKRWTFWSKNRKKSNVSKHFNNIKNKHFLKKLTNISYQKTQKYLKNRKKQNISIRFVKIKRIKFFLKHTKPASGQRVIKSQRVIETYKKRKKSKR
jgi:hypothetical protein